MESDKSISAPSSDGHSEGVQRIRPLHGRTSGPARRSTKGQWTAEEDEILRKAVQRFKGKTGKKLLANCNIGLSVAECFKDRTDVQCLHRWQKVLNPELVKGPWSKEEDEIIIELVNKYGPKKWSTIAQHLPGRIGKQCRERWHNHLNPSINKEAWTQQEELSLIRAHQIYGNRWAELTKFLPGSSVKKKLDSYLASGLLEQFQGLPLVPHQNQPMPSSSSRVQSSGDDPGPKCGIETEEISECSQESIIAGCSQTASGFGNAVLHTTEEFQLAEESGLGKERSSSPASCSEQYFTSVGDVTFSIPEIPCEVGCSSNFLQQNFSQNTITSASSEYQFNSQELPNISSLELGQESSGLSTHCIAANESHELVNVPFQTSMGNMTAGSAKPDHIFISDDECCRFLFADAMNGGVFSSGNFTKGSNSVACIDSLNCQSSNYQISETDRSAQPFSPSKSVVLAATCSRPFPSGPSLLSADDSNLICRREQNQIINHSFAANEQEYVISAHDGFIYTDGTDRSPCGDGTDNTDMQEQHYLREPSKLAPPDTFTSGSDTIQSCPVDEMPNVHTEQQDAGALCYEPPRFPSLDIPFLSCDLIQSGSDMQQEYSPLGIRQLMMSSMSMNCITPFRLWESPSRDDSPDAVLKSAARLSLEFSRLEVLFDESETHRASLQSPSNQKRNHESIYEDKENLDPALEGRQEKGRDCSAFVDNKISEKDCDSSDSQDNKKERTVDGVANTKVHNDANAQHAEQLSGALGEDSMNDLLFSPDQVGFKGDKAFAPSSRTPKFIPFGETPFKRSIESPSAWKSPWFINSFLPGPRVDTDISIEDIGIFLSPGERSYDAIALMKQLSEHTASAYADALEVLGNETPETILEKRRSNMDQENNCAPNIQPENVSHLASNTSTECRTLDFSECETPGKRTERERSSTAMTFSSPSSYLLKGCR
ncbi:hypothetical protein GH714_036173 [Hevea brasiliensis]|uniref:Uncharacterized protein n=1 Tax=Hevea brasiliensis TaxID=3981 RepID=A0A6A6KFV2_HEVBR|nr:hypothetical protein GH714_036173 [Hevea brasiliensis]